jgi:type I restriction enzyme S subunit
MSSESKTTVTKGQARPGLVPKLRFPEFRGAVAWDCDALENVADFVNEKIPLERVGLENYVSTENILADYGGVTKASKLPTTGSVTRYRPHDILVSNIRPYLKKVWAADKDGGASNDVIVIRAKQRLCPQYFSWLLKNDVFIDYVMTSAKGVKMPRGDVGSMKAYPALYPSKAEQQKIAECLSSVDDLIAAKARKVDALKTRKKGLMQQLFPREGETQPYLRFSSEGDWTVVGLPEVAFFQEGPGIMAVDFRAEGVPLVRLAGVAGSVVTLDGCNYLEPGKVDQKWSHFRLSVNDLIISTSAIFGLSSVVTNATAGAVFYTGLIRFRPSSKRLDRGYLQAFLASPHFERQVESAAVGGGIKHFGPSHIKRMKIPIPPLDEQQGIAACLSSLDDLITLELRTLEALKTHKKGLMQHLFPTPEEVEA